MAFTKTLETVLDELSDILKDIFNLSLQTGVFPKSLKNVRVVPVYKSKGSQNDVTNYRPISLLSNIDTVFEKLVYSRVISFFNTNHVLFKRQYCS